MKLATPLSESRRFRRDPVGRCSVVRRNRAASIVVAAILAATMLSRSAGAAAPFLEKVDIFESGRDGYAFYRVPGMVVTAKGTVLAYCEARRTGRSDWENIDLMMRRSTDGGKTWDAPRKVAEVAGPIEKNPVALERKQASSDEISYTNPVAIAGRDGTVHFIFCLEFNRVFYRRSDDDGVTFSRPVEITPALRAFRPRYDWRVIAAGPMHGIELKNGRLVVPIWMTTGAEGSGFKPSVTSVIFSDDHGRTWQCGEIAVPSTDEWINSNSPAVVELADGRVMLNVRNESKPNRRLVTLSPDGATGWSKPAFDDALFEPICEASLVRLTDKATSDRNRLLFANPHNLARADGKEGPGRPRDRKNLAVKLSYDEGRTWPVSRTLEPADAQFSDLAVLPDGTLLCLYESGQTRDEKSFAGHNIRQLTLSRFNLEWLTDGRDSIPIRTANRPAGSSERSTTTAPRKSPAIPAAAASSFPPLPLAGTITVNGIAIDPKSPPAGLVVREQLGLLTVNALDGEIVHRTATRVLETRAVITPRGDYLLMFPEGEHYATAKGRPKVNTMMAYRSTDRGRTWRGPTVAFDIDYSQHGFVPLIPRGSKRIYAFGTQPVPGKFTHENGQRENAPIGFRWSDDDGTTWSPVKLIEPRNDPGFHGMSVMRMTETDAGTWLIGSHNADWAPKPFTTRQYLLRSEDKGETWTLLPGPQPNGWFAAGFNRMDEGRPLNLGGGRVFFMSRTPEGHLWSARSSDDGKTWTVPAPTSLVHPDAPPMLFTLSDGKTLVAFHHNRTGMIDSASGPRSEIWCATSRDEGRTWSEPRFVFANALRPDLKSLSFNHQCSYLDLFIDDGVMHIFLPHRWQQVLHLALKESALSALPTKAQLAR